MARPLKSKYVGETITVDWDFTDVMLVGETISTMDVTVSLWSGTDLNPSDILTGAPSASSTVVSHKVTSGYAGVIYLLYCTIETSTGRTFTRTHKLAVLLNTGGGSGGMYRLPLLDLQGDLPDGIVGNLYVHNLDIVGGIAPYTNYRVIAGDELTWAGANIIDDEVQYIGIPSDPGTWSFTPEVEDWAGQRANEPQTVTVTGPGPTMYSAFIALDNSLSVFYSVDGASWGGQSFSVAPSVWTGSEILIESFRGKMWWFTSAGARYSTNVGTWNDVVGADGDVPTGLVDTGSAFVLAYYAGPILRSLDGIEFTEIIALGVAVFNSPVNIGDTIVCGGPSRDVQRSTDGGLTWSLNTIDTGVEDGGAEIRRLVATPNSICAFPYATNCSIARSTDAGATWGLVANPTTAAILQAAYNPDDDIILAIADTPAPATLAEVLRSTDRGATWSIVGNVPYFNRFPLTQNQNNKLKWTGDRWVFASSIANGTLAIITSEDQGATWTVRYSTVTANGIDSCCVWRAS